jgi:hypothetical protein
MRKIRVCRWRGPPRESSASRKKQFSRLLQLDVEQQMNEAKRFNDAVAAEERKLGASFHSARLPCSPS